MHAHDMDRMGRERTRSAVLAACVTVVTAAGLPACRQAPPSHPIPDAIIVVSIDSLRADYLNSYGYVKYETSPVLDAFAQDAVLFENCIVAEPWTLTSHMSLMTGLYPHHHAVRDHDDLLGPGVPTLAQRLRERGYKTQGFVDGPYLSKRWGFDRGFDQYVVAMRKGFGSIMPRALSWLREHRDDRFFLFLHTLDVHSIGFDPYYASPAPYRGMFSRSSPSDLRLLERKAFRRALIARDLSDADKDLIRATYAEGVRYVDDQLGRLFDELESLDIYDRAVVIVSSDHGDGLYDHGEWGHTEVYDHTIRVPLLVKLPANEYAGTRVSSVVEWTDLMPTILALAGAASPTPLDGESVLGLLDDDSGEGVAYSIQSLRLQDVELFSIRTRRHHYIVDRGAQLTYLFDLEVDPLERNNLSPSGLQEEAKLRDLLARWMAEHDEATNRNESSTGRTLGERTRRQLRALGYAE